MPQGKIVTNSFFLLWVGGQLVLRSDTDDCWPAGEPACPESGSPPARHNGEG